MPFFTIVFFGAIVIWLWKFLERTGVEQDQGVGAGLAPWRHGGRRPEAMMRGARGDRDALEFPGTFRVHRNLTVCAAALARAPTCKRDWAAAGAPL